VRIVTILPILSSLKFKIFPACDQEPLQQRFAERGGGHSEPQP
jgi:hypothetical protein